MEPGLGELVRKVGRLFIESVLGSEVEQLAGPRSARQMRQAYRCRVEQGSCLIDRQRVPIARPRVRACRVKRATTGNLRVVSARFAGPGDDLEQHYGLSVF